MPVIGIVQVGMQSIADRYSYLPLVGIFILVAWSAAEVLARWPWLKPPLTAATAAALAACCLLTSAQVCRWASTETLFTHTAAVTEDNSVALTNLGLVAIHKEHYAEAERLLRESLRIEPMHIDALGNLATMYVKQKNYRAALAIYSEIIRRYPNSLKAYGQMAHAFELQGDRPQAEVCLRRAAELEPASASLHANLALNQQLQGKTQEALENYLILLRLRPGDRETLNNIAWIYATHPDARFRDGAKAVDLLRPLAAKADSDSNLLDTLAAAYAEAGRFDDALQTIGTTIEKAKCEKKSPETIADFQQRLALYKKHQPYRDRQLLGQSK